MLAVRLQTQRADFGLDVDFKVPTPGIVALFGRSGCGKSTLINLIAGLFKPAHGRITLNDDVLFDEDAGVNVAVEQRRIGYVFQDARLFPHMSVWSNLQYGLRRRKEQPVRITLEAVVDLLGLDTLLGRRPRHLSGGERQRVALGRALLAQPRLLLLDEPLASLDLARREEVLPYLEKLRDAFRLPMVYVSHQFDEIIRLADHVVLLDAGRVTAQGSITALSLRPELRAITGPEALGAVVEATVDTVDGVTRLARVIVGNGALLVDGVGLEAGQRLRLQLLARDLILATEQPHGLSVRNMLVGIVTAMNSDDAGSVLVQVDVGGIHLVARITTSAASELQIEAGRQIWVLVKTVTLRGRIFPGIRAAANA